MQKYTGMIIRYHRGKKNMTQDDLAKRLDVSRQTVSLFESHSIPMNKLKETVSILSIPSDEIKEALVKDYIKQIDAALL